MHIQPMLDTEEERRITPDGAVYESAFELVKAWTRDYRVGVCGYTGKRSTANPTEPAADLSNLLASRRKGKEKAE